MSNRNRLSIQRKASVHQADQMLDISMKPLFIGVTGGTAGGKTTVCEIIKEEFQDMCSIVTFDNFYKGLSK
jgi:uridine kinase